MRDPDVLGNSICGGFEIKSMRIGQREVVVNNNESVFYISDASVSSFDVSSVAQRFVFVASSRYELKNGLVPLDIAASLAECSTITLELIACKQFGLGLKPATEYSNRIVQRGTVTPWLFGSRLSPWFNARASQSLIAGFNPIQTPKPGEPMCDPIIIKVGLVCDQSDDELRVDNLRHWLLHQRGFDYWQNKANESVRITKRLLEEIKVREREVVRLYDEETIAAQHVYQIINMEDVKHLEAEFALGDMAKIELYDFKEHPLSEAMQAYNELQE